AYALRRSADRAAAEEAVSETYLTAWRREDVFPREALPWLLGIARKVLANQRRSASRRRAHGVHLPLESVQAPPPRFTPYAQLAAGEAFGSAFSRLGERGRETLSLIAWDGLEPREAAKVVGCTPAVFSIRLHRARRRLMKELEASGHSLGASRPSSLRER